MPDDRFSEDEIRQVFRQAAAAQARSGPDAPAAGLTLDEMAEVGEASGIPRALVEAAARAVRRGVPESRRARLGPVPTGVFRSVPLAEPPSEALWERLVADARRTFDARGHAETVGSEREWRNGNLRMTLEPAGDGSRLTLRSDRRSSTSGLLAAAVAEGVVGLVLVVSDVSRWPLAFVFGVMAVVFGVSAWARQRTWAATRERQMERLTERAAAEPTASADPAVADKPQARRRADGPVLDLDALGDEPEPTAQRARRRGRA